LLVVDAVTALGGVPVEVDQWGIDGIYSATQKCLSCPPGLAPVSFSQRAVDKIMNRKQKVRSWYLDLSLIANYWGDNRAYHHTAPINMTYALHEALRLVLEEGLEVGFSRHQRNHKVLCCGLSELGFEFTAQPGHRLPQLNAVRLPKGIDDGLRRQLLDEFAIEIGGGLGAFKGQVWRIGLMGHSAREENVTRLLDALAELIRR
ncbi:MAG: aminotransferase class V-fold PLP-dependent enzyme, partial [Planctomycetales bacterium]